MRGRYCFFRSITLFVILLSGGVACARDITGAGATSPAGAYEKWAANYRIRANVGFYYQAIGSGAGIQQITAKLVDFGASDVPMSGDELSTNGLTQFPTLIGGIVPVVNIAGVAPNQLKLSGEVLADIFLGKITQWNDPRIAADNNGLKLPDQRISVIHRGDQSGSSFIFTSYLAQVSPEWKRRVGVATTVQWPVGAGGKGNDGVASYVGRLQGAIGVVEYATAAQNKMAYVQMKNRDGQFVSPSESSLKDAAAHATWDAAKGFDQILVNQPGRDSWPLTTATFVLMYKKQESPERGQEVLKFFDWAYSNGNQLASDLGYVPLPESVVMLVRNAWRAQVKDASGHALWQ